MNNLLAGTGIGTVFVDHGLHILRFTPAATRIINLIPSDIGRPVGHLVSNLAGYDNLAADTQAVLDTLAPKELEVQTKAGVWYSMRILPYRTLDNVIEGAVVTFIDINNLKLAQEALRQSRQKFASLFEKASFAATLATLPEATIIDVNQSFENIFGYDKQELIGKTAQELGLNRIQVSDLLERGSITDAEIELRTKSGERRTFLNSMDVIEIGDQKHALSVLQDITRRKQAELALRASEAKLAKGVDALEMLHQLALVSMDGADPAILDKLVSEAIEICDADFGTLQILDHRSSNLRIMGQHGFPQWWLDFWERPSDHRSVSAIALERRERIIVEDVEESSIFIGTAALEIQLRAGVRALCAIPLISRLGTALGVFTVDYKKPQRPDERALRLLDLLARQTADIIERARMEASLRESEDRFRALADASRKEAEEAKGEGVG
jgi:PAS domain S-box-containing protein